MADASDSAGRDVSPDLGALGRSPAVAEVVVNPSVLSTCARLDNGTVWCWGDNLAAELGDGTEVAHHLPGPTVGIASAVQVAVDSTDACAVVRDGTVWCWGDNPLDVLGTGIPERTLLPTRVRTLDEVTQLALVEHAGYALRADGTVVAWGSGTTLPVVGLDAVVALDASVNHACALRRDGTVWCWGRNDFGQLGLGAHDTSEHVVPAMIPGLTQVTAIATGSESTCALRRDGTVWCWGDNDTGQTGNGFDGSDTCPMPVLRPEAPHGVIQTPCVVAPTQVHGLTDVVALSLRDATTCVVRRDGTVWCWGLDPLGYETPGLIGDGLPATELCPQPFASPPEITPAPATCRRAPVQVRGLDQAVAVSAGFNHFCALQRDATAWCWGDNAFGQLGDGTTIDRPTPVPVLWPVGAGTTADAGTVPDAAVDASVYPDAGMDAGS